MLFTKNYLLTFVMGLIAVMALTVACAAQPPEGPASSGDEQEIEQGSHDENAMEHGGDEEHELEHNGDEMDAMEHDGDDMEAMEHEQSEDGEPLIPNNGAVIRIVSPEDDIEITVDDIVEVEVEVENFSLGEDGNHWHIFVDGKSRGMVVGGDTDHVVRGLEPGEHEISAFMANGAHEQLEDGASVIVNVTE